MDADAVGDADINAGTNKESAFCMLILAVIYAINTALRDFSLAETTVQKQACTLSDMYQYPQVLNAHHQGEIFSNFIYCSESSITLQMKKIEVEILLRFREQIYQGDTNGCNLHYRDQLFPPQSIICLQFLCKLKNGHQFCTLRSV
ncbi:Protein trichome birefringence-like 3 [Senna tora]|uniref:Protein trichome birefringence-like 3 n=1 Tax=Senna tora TaxID=362788 RepID=A0A834TN23_9FABA|nr:Protein trichome birefringence-like 3 [Senna tora]